MPFKKGHRPPPPKYPDPPAPAKRMKRTVDSGSRMVRADHWVQMGKALAECGGNVSQARLRCIQMGISYSENTWHKYANEGNVKRGLPALKDMFKHATNYVVAKAQKQIDKLVEDGLTIAEAWQLRIAERAATIRVEDMPAYLGNELLNVAKATSILTSLGQKQREQDDLSAMDFDELRRFLSEAKSSVEKFRDGLVPPKELDQGSRVQYQNDEPVGGYQRGAKILQLVPKQIDGTVEDVEASK